MMHICKYCNYSTKNTWNMKRHYSRVHYEYYDWKNEVASNLVLQASKSVLQASNLVLPASNLVLDNTSASALTTISNNNNDHSENICEKCNKLFSCMKTLKVHSNICKGIVNPFQCPLCNKIFNNTSNKNRHLRICKEQSMIKANNEAAAANGPGGNAIINGNVNIEGTHNTLNNTTNNITVLNFSDQFLEFNMDNITTQIVKKLIKCDYWFIPDNMKMDMIGKYAKLLLANPANKCVKKTNLRSVYSTVHTGNNNWDIVTDKEVYPKLTSNIAQNMSDTLSVWYDNKQISIRKKKFDEFIDRLNSVIDEGYSNDEDEEVNKETNMFFKHLVVKMKGIVYQCTKAEAVKDKPAGDAIGNNTDTTIT